ncbi:MAG: hypothetical protein ACR2OC_02935, partial [Solirubrobacterales bacterium]
IIDVHAIIDLHSFPLVVCLWEPGAGAFIGSGVEDARELVVDPLALGPAVIVEALESLLVVISAAHDSARGHGNSRVAARPLLRQGAAELAPRAEWRRWSHPRIASSPSGTNRKAVLSLSG